MDIVAAHELIDLFAGHLFLLQKLFGQTRQFGPMCRQMLKGSFFRFTQQLAALLRR